VSETNAFATRLIQLPAILQVEGRAPFFGMIAKLTDQGLAYDFQSSLPDRLVGSKARLDFDFRDQHFHCDTLIVHIQGQRALLTLKQVPAPVLSVLQTLSRQGATNLAGGLSILQIQHACHTQFIQSMKSVVDDFYQILPERIDAARLRTSRLTEVAELDGLYPMLSLEHDELTRRLTLAYPMYPELKSGSLADGQSADQLELVDMDKMDDWVRRTGIAHGADESLGPIAHEFNQHYAALLKKDRKQVTHPYQAESILACLAERLEPLELGPPTRALCYEVMCEAFKKHAQPLYQAMADIIGDVPLPVRQDPADAPNLEKWLQESSWGGPPGTDEDTTATQPHPAQPNVLQELLARLTGTGGGPAGAPPPHSTPPAGMTGLVPPHVPGLLARDRVLGHFLPDLAIPAPGEARPQPGWTPPGDAGQNLGGFSDLDNTALEGLIAFRQQPPPIDSGPENLNQASQVRALMLQAQGLLLEYTLNGLTYQTQPDHPAWTLLNSLDALHRGADDRGQFLDPAIHRATSLAMQWLLGQENADAALQQVNALLDRINAQFHAQQQSRRAQQLARLDPLKTDSGLINTGWCVVKGEAEAIPYEVLGMHYGKWALLNRSATALLEIPAERFLHDLDEGLIEEAGSFDEPYLERIANVTLTASLNAVHAYTWQDPASGCLKRAALMDELERRLTHAVTQPPTYCALIEIPTMRASLSSLPGDELTVMQKRTGEILLESLQSGEHCGRLSDVSFMIVFSPQNPAHLAERLTLLKIELESLHPEWKMLGAVVPLADSESDSAPTPSNVLRRANQACAPLRQQSGFDLSCLNTANANIVQDDALPYPALYLRCQKISACTEGALSHYEVLLGVDQEQIPNHTTQSLVVMAEQTGRIQELDIWVLRSTLEWMGQNGHLIAELSGLSVNLSGASLTVPQHVDAMVDLLSEFPDVTGKLIFEVTETAAIGNLDAAVRSLRKLRRLGCRIALDDFGSGYSSYSYLRSLPLDYLKIDGTYIRNILSDKTDQALTASMVDVAHALGLKVIAEFVDSEGAYSWLKAQGVDYVQGYWVHKPQALNSLVLH